MDIGEAGVQRRHSHAHQVRAAEVGHLRILDYMDMSEYHPLRVARRQSWQSNAACWSR